MSKIEVNGKPIYETEYWQMADTMVKDTLEQLEIIRNNEIIDRQPEYDYHGVDRYTD